MRITETGGHRQLLYSPCWKAKLDEKEEKDNSSSDVNVQGRCQAWCRWYEYEKGDESDIFKTTSSIIVDLENYTTKVTSSGIDLIKHADSTNIDNSMRELISNLKNKSKYQILYEKLDPPLLEQINNIENENVKNFHRDNFLYFKDFSATLKKEEIISKILEKQAAEKTAAAGTNPETLKL